MKKILLFAMIAFMALPMLADLNGNGFYRVRNAFTKRYAYLLDDKGAYSFETSSADVGALKLYADTERVISDPAAVFYVEEAPQGNDYYDIQGQGTSIYGFMHLYLTILQDRKPYDDENTYCIYASKLGVSKYLGDVWNHPEEDEGLASVDAAGDDRRWNFYPFDAASDCYFGVKPTVKAKGKHYAPFFSGFPFSAYSDGVKFYTVTDIDTRGGAIITEIEGTVPAGTPVIIECKGSDPSGNRLNVGGVGEAVAGNLLKGVYFNNTSMLHKNLTPFDRETMRVLGVGKDGRPAFVEADLDYLPRNQAYLQLTDPSQYGVKEFLLLTEEEREAELNAVSVIEASAMVDVYSLDGRLVKAGVSKSEVPALGKGMYILRGNGISEKMMVH